ncbi:hypothetical protein Skr01_19800 [Sphaerisporangium krabiense]|uniref:Transcriptional regulator with XRE-family HTH domain n=1 Tax=Sphaerisporangium krabiense TaxID=763782 RepID=A0A7W8Z5G9_9ACTN|nr:helix-turn-helix transcriptional regulator [Sphaerisporangium krabiense]MBB5627737.1 transcriptional regulator with XRE-family HTH domain [Sphaerisporangium krabiense]GII61895.1 hypothetical protein Skr01_19800 [Sphaerisporangium krabiense]
MRNLYDRFAATVRGARALAAARLRHEVLATLHQALQLCGLSQSEVAEELGLRRSAVNQVFRGDGNVRINTLADYLHAMGFEADVRLVRAGEPRSATVQQRAVRPATRDWRVRVPQATASGVFLTRESEGRPIFVEWNSTPIGTTNGIRLVAEVHPVDPRVPSPETYISLGTAPLVTT